MDSHLGVHFLMVLVKFKNASEHFLPLFRVISGNGEKTSLPIRKNLIETVNGGVDDFAYLPVVCFLNVGNNFILGWLSAAHNITSRVHYTQYIRHSQ